jgi:F-type H+-transporting ATPase subunit O
MLGYLAIVNKQVSESILGGLIVEIGDRTIDLSVQSRVSKLNQLLYETL